MGKKLPPNELALYKRCDEVLHYLWDPIGVAGSPGARDEYASYLPQVFKMLKEGLSEEHITEYLIEIHSYMGMSPDSVCAKATAEVLINWRDWIAKNNP
jgi:hypothetical protein